MKFSKRLKEIREDKGYTQQELSEAIHVSSGTISHYENGTREPGTETIAQLADFLNVSADYLLGITNVNLPPKEMQKTYCKGVSTNKFLEKSMWFDTPHRQLLVSIMNCIELDQIVKNQGKSK